MFTDTYWLTEFIDYKDFLRFKLVKMIIQQKKSNTTDPLIVFIL